MILPMRKLVEQYLDAKYMRTVEGYHLTKLTYAKVILRDEHAILAEQIKARVLKG
jgi:hypothetical protein